MRAILCGGGHPVHERREQWTDGANYVTISPGVAIGYARNERTAAAMRADGFRVISAEAFLKAHRARERYDRERPFGGWILTIASRVCLDRLRRRRHERRLFAAPVEEPAEPPARADGQLNRLLVGERRRRVRRAIAGLPERYRQVLVMRYYGELAYEEIAAGLDLKRNHVAVLIHRAKQRLRQALAAGAEEASG